MGPSNCSCKMDSKTGFILVQKSLKFMKFKNFQELSEDPLCCHHRMFVSAVDRSKGKRCPKHDFRTLLRGGIEVDSILIFCETKKCKEATSCINLQVLLSNLKKWAVGR